jgi:hypothetical protein
VFPHEYKRALAELATKAAAEPGGPAGATEKTAAKTRSGESKSATVPAK